MAVKDHSLDGKIISAAKEEFLSLGYEKASLHKIADKAGITTGALYTRYKGKDDLFCSLVTDVIKDISIYSEPIRNDYMTIMEKRDPNSILDVIKKEEKIYLDILFDHYDECVLLFCKSDGSSIERMLDTMMEEKSRSTVEYLKDIAQKEISLDGIDIIMSEQFKFFRRILEKGYSKEKAISCMKNIEIFLDAGWKDLFDRMM